MARRSGKRGGKTVVRTPYTSAFKLGGGNSKRTSKRSNGKSR